MKTIHLFSQSEKRPGTLDPRSMLLPVLFDLVCGVLLILLGKRALQVTSYALAGVMILCAAWLIMNYIRSNVLEKITGFHLAGGLALAVSGVLLAFSPTYLEGFLPFIWGLALLFGAFMKIQYAFTEKLLDIKRWWIMLIFAAFSLAIGSVCLANPDFLKDSRELVIGIMLVVEAVLDLTVFVLINNALKKKIPTSAADASAIAGASQAQRPASAKDPAQAAAQAEAAAREAEQAAAQAEEEQK